MTILRDVRACELTMFPSGNVYIYVYMVNYLLLVVQYEIFIINCIKCYVLQQPTGCVVAYV